MARSPTAVQQQRIVRFSPRQQAFLVVLLKAGRTLRSASREAWVPVQDVPEHVVAEWKARCGSSRLRRAPADDVAGGRRGAGHAPPPHADAGRAATTKRARTPVGRPEDGGALPTPPATGRRSVRPRLLSPAAEVDRPRSSASPAAARPGARAHTPPPSSSPTHSRSITPAPPAATLLAPPPPTPRVSPALASFARTALLATPPSLPRAAALSSAGAAPKLGGASRPATPSRASSFAFPSPLASAALCSPSLSACPPTPSSDAAPPPSTPRRRPPLRHLSSLASSAGTSAGRQGEMTRRGVEAVESAWAADEAWAV